MSHSSLVEPTGLLGHILAHPPQDFEAFTTPLGLPGFVAAFDLLTTAEPELLARIAKLPLAGALHRLLTLRTTFAGTTASEYFPFDTAHPPAMQLRDLLDSWAGRSQLLIVKDIPEASPLLTAETNAHATALVEAAQRAGFFIVEGQALAYVPLDFTDGEEYLTRLSSGRRRDIRRKLRARAGLRLEIIETGSEPLRDAAFRAELHAQYLEVFAQSEIHFDRLTPAYFDAVLQDASLAGRLFLYWQGERLIGHNLCFIHDGMLVDKYVGFRYPAARENNLYFVSWFENLDYAARHGLRHFVAGGIDPTIKAYLGARFTFTRHAVYVRNPLLRRLLRSVSGRFESDRVWFEQNEYARGDRA